MVGLPESEVRLDAYSREWPAMFEREEARLRGALGARLLDVQHIGSTAVPGLCAKPIVDFAVRIGSLAEVPACVAALEKLGYTYKGEYGLPGRHFFTLGEPVTHHLHLVAAGGEHWDAWLRFRDLLRADTGVREAYAALKADLARRHAGDRKAYTAAKNAFIAGALAAPRVQESP